MKTKEKNLKENMETPEWGILLKNNINDESIVDLDSRVSVRCTLESMREFQALIKLGENDIEFILKDKVIQLMNEMMNDALCKPFYEDVKKCPNSNNIAEFINEWAKINIK